jgi:hypothetical protein
MVGVGVGAAAGGGMSALNGGSTEDILKGALIGSATGAVTGGVGSALSGPAAGAVSGGAVGGGAGGTGGAVGGGTGGAIGSTGSTIATTTADQLTQQAVQQGVSKTAEQGIASAASNAIPSTFGSGLGTGGTEVVGSSVGGNLGASGNLALNNALTASSVNAGEAGAVGGAAGGAAPTTFIPQEGLGGVVDKGVSPNAAAGYKPPIESTWGQRLADTMGADLGTVGNKVAGGAIQNSVYGAGIGGLSAAAQGKDIGKGMLTGGAAGGFGGAVGAELGQAGGAVGEFATAHPTITAGGISALAAPVMDATFQPSDASGEENSSSPFKTKWRVSKDYKPYISKGTIYPYAQGGITDLDAYDQTPQMQRPGTLDIPNRNEVANNQGYLGDSVQLMAGGGLAYADGGILNNLPGHNTMKSVYGTTFGDAISPGLRDFLFGTPDDQLSDEQKAKKKELLAQQNQAQTVQQPQQDQEQGMAHGGISDLGGYSDGGRLLKGPGDGVSDDIPASIGGKQPARLAEGEFVVPARIVSELGNGSTDAGAKRLYQMMERIQSDRKKTTGKGKFSDNPKAYKHLPV